MTESTLSTVIILGAFMAGATMFCIAVYREMQEREAQRSKEADAYRNYLKGRAERWKKEDARIAAILAERAKKIKPLSMCSELDENEPLT